MAKTVVITGGSRGIGKACTELFSIRQDNIILNYYKSEEEANDLYRKLKQSNNNIHLFKTDVSNRKDVDRMIDFCIEKFGSIDVLINNAGISQTKLFTEIEDEDWNKIIEVNLTGTFYCCRSAAKQMIKQKRGNIINISSIWGITGASCEVHYSAAKAGIIGLTKALAKELGPSNIKVNCVAPGIIKTDMLNGYSLDDLKELENQTPLMRLGTPQEIAAVVYFLASEDSNFLTGQIISPNGGFVI